MTLETEAHIRDLFAAQAFLQTVEAEITALEPGLCIVAAPVSDALLDNRGAAHAALVFAVAEGAATGAALSRLEKDAEVATVEMKVTHLAPARGDRLVAEARVEAAQARLIVVSAAVYARAGDRRDKVALVQGTLLPV